MSGLSRFLMQEVEMPLLAVVADMEGTGYPLDRQHFYDLRARLEPELTATRDRLYGMAGETFNPNSPKQVAQFVYETLGCEVVSRTTTGEPSTNGRTLQRLARQHPEIEDIVRFRELQKILSTYCTIPDKVDDDGRLHVEFNQLAACTGRFSSGSIIQTVPKNDEFGIRKGFRAPDGFQIVGADYKQQELNVLAQVSGDTNLLKAIETGIDLHGLAAVKVFKLDCQPHEVEAKYPQQRSQIKAIQFGIVYGKTAYGLADSLGITQEAAEQLIGDYFGQFPAVKRYIVQIHRRLLRDGYVDDVFGRRRSFPIVKQQRPTKPYRQMTAQQQKLAKELNAAKRQAQNFVIQAPSATITKLAMIRCHQHISRKYADDARLILTLHDELQFEVRNEAVVQFAAELPTLMCDLGLERFGFKLPLSVEIKTGPSWGEMRKPRGATDGDSLN
jgi:DNA polymerase I